MATLDEPGWTANSSDGTIGAARTSRGVRMCNNCNYAERLFKPFTVDLVLFFKDTSAVLILFSFCRSIARQVPDCPLGFVLYARSCLGFQQHRTAHVFSDKGVLVADRVQDEISK